ncbi:MAG: nicotinate-nicotinamide nucleotide adenylyltransferase [Planctomycetota bacterium]
MSAGGLAGEAEARLAALSADDVVLVYGGTFDPPHRGHLELPEAARAALCAALVAYVPAGRSPFKQGRVQSPPEVRLKLVEAAVAGRASAVVLPWEVAAGDGEATYTIDTVERLARWTRARLRLLIGADQAASFARWKSAERLAALAEPCVLARSVEGGGGLAWLDALPSAERAVWAPRVVAAPVVDVSATEVRERVARGASIEGMCPPGVVALIESLGLYRDA